MKKYIINNFYICGNYIAGDCIDIHDNPSATVYHRYPVPAPDAVEDVTPVETTVEPTMQQPQEASEQSAPEKATMTSCLFTKKAFQEQKQAEITQALKRSLSGRNDKARALVEEVRRWQKEGYIDPNYNARVMYDELNKLIPIPFGYPGFRKYYYE